MKREKEVRRKRALVQFSYGVSNLPVKKVRREQPVVTPFLCNAFSSSDEFERLYRLVSEATSALFRSSNGEWSRGMIFTAWQKNRSDPLDYDSVASVYRCGL